MTNTENTTEGVIKSDTIGRMITPTERRRSLVEEYEKSGLSGTKFAALVGVKYTTFAGWLQRYRRQRGGRGEVKGVADAASQMRWLETVIEQAQSPAGKDRSALIVQLPGGARAEISTVHQAGLVAALLQALEKPAAAC